MTSNLPGRREPLGQRPQADGTPAPGDGAGPGGGPQPVLDQALDGGSLAQLRASVAAHAGQAGLPRQRADDVVIAVHELAANIVRHGSGHGRLRIWRHGQLLHCQVSDEGAPQPGGRPGADPASDPLPWPIRPGHGLWLVRQLADRTSLHPGPRGTDVTISFRLGPAAGPPFRPVHDGRHRR